MQSQVIRSKFLNYFKHKGHSVLPSSSLVPADDPTLLFTNSGMVQFKNVFLGKESIAHPRAVTAQRCVRAGGKHNDLDNVGYTARHHTFFEMLGNFSFGDYFKQQAIAYAWEFVTKVLALPEERLWVTIYHEDSESEAIWLEEIGVSPERFSRLGESNFWSMGDTGPCGPCSEIFYDHGRDVAGGPPGTPEEDGDRYVEIWNLVFMQYQRHTDGTLSALDNPCIDTGMGLERVAAVMQGVVSNYATDIFVPLIETASAITGCNNIHNPSLQVLADHVRSSCCLLLDGVTASNEGRGYVLRRIIRRATRHAYSLGTHEPFLHKLAEVFIAQMLPVIPEFARHKQRILNALDNEETQFHRTLNQGMIELEKAFTTTQDAVIEGDVLFRLYDTFGFPVDMVADIAREREKKIDIAGFERAMQSQKERSRNQASFQVRQSQQPDLTGTTLFVGYQKYRCNGTIVHILQHQQSHQQSVQETRDNGELMRVSVVKELVKDQSGIVVLDTTSFYAESGGQIGDSGTLTTDKGKFLVRDVQKVAGNYHHIGKVIFGTIDTGAHVIADVDKAKRKAITCHHSATHLLHAALRQVLGEGVMQKGSLVDEKRLRFDFSHHQPISAEDLNRIESLVNSKILDNLAVTAEEMPLTQALEQGALAFFEEKYGKYVRVLCMGACDTSTLTKEQTSFGPFSVELCGGTHVTNTGEIGSVHIISQSGIASGIRRIEAIAGAVANKYMQCIDSQLQHAVRVAKTTPDLLASTITQLQHTIAQQKRELDRLRAKVATSSGIDKAIHIENIKGIQTIITRIDATAPSALSFVVDQYKNTIGSGVVVVAGVFDGKVVMAAGVTKDMVSKIHAGTLLQSIAPIVDGKAGGKPYFAQGGGSNISQIDALLENAKTYIS